MNFRQLRLLGTCLVALSFGCTEMPMRPLQLTVEPRWVRTALPADFAGLLPGHDKAPLLTDDMVYVPSPAEGVIAFDRFSGTEKWRFRISEGVSGGIATDGQSLFFGGGNGQFYSVSARLGRIQWAFPLRSESVSIPVVSENSVFVLSGNNILISLNKNNGKQNWLYSRPQATSITVKGGSQPAINMSPGGSGQMYVGFSDGALVAIQMKDGSLIWERQLDRDPRFRDVDSGPVLVGDSLYTGSFEGGFFSLKRSTGEIQWKIDEGAVHPMVTADGVGYLANTSGQVFSFDLANGKKIWTYTLKSGIAAQPVVFREFLIFGESSDAIRILDRRTGAVVSSFTTGRGVLAPVTGNAASGEVFALSSIGNIYKLDVNWRRNF